LEPPSETRLLGLSAKVEEMYMPEVLGRTGADSIHISAE
jgi:hypothetical protein